MTKKPILLNIPVDIYSKLVEKAGKGSVTKYILEELKKSLE
jgi:hypothetical protein